MLKTADRINPDTLKNLNKEKSLLEHLKKELEGHDICGYCGQDVGVFMKF